jgi:multiple antibiotic resistance protein
VNQLAQFAVVAFSSLLAVVNPVSAVPVLIGVTAERPASQRPGIVLRAIIAAAAILVLFAALGAAILSFFGITTYAFRIAGGIIFFGIGWDMLQARRSRVKTTTEEEEERASREDTAIIPLGIPTIAGPGAITTVIALSGQAVGPAETAVVYGAIFAVLAVTGAVLLVAPWIVRVMGNTGMNVVTRLLGLLVMVIGTQFVLNGAREAAEALFGL